MTKPRAGRGLGGLKSAAPSLRRLERDAQHPPPVCPKLGQVGQVRRAFVAVGQNLGGEVAGVISAVGEGVTVIVGVSDGDGVTVIVGVMVAVGVSVGVGVGTCRLMWMRRSA